MYFHWLNLATLCGPPSTRVGEGREVTWESLAGIRLMSGTPGRPGLQLQGYRVGPWEKALSLFSEISLEGTGRAQQLQKEALKTTWKQFSLLLAAANTSTSAPGLPDHTPGHLS